MALILSVTVCVCVYVCAHAHVLSCSVVSNSLADHSLPCSSVHEIFQTRMLEWVAISCSRGSSQPRDQTRVSCLGGRILYHVGIIYNKLMFILTDIFGEPGSAIYSHSAVKIEADSNTTYPLTFEVGLVYWTLIMNLWKNPFSSFVLIRNLFHRLKASCLFKMLTFPREVACYSLLVISIIGCLNLLYCFIDKRVRDIVAVKN